MACFNPHMLESGSYQAHSALSLSRLSVSILICWKVVATKEGEFFVKTPEGCFNPHMLESGSYRLDFDEGPFYQTVSILICWKVVATTEEREAFVDEWLVSILICWKVVATWFNYAANIYNYCFNPHMLESGSYPLNDTYVKGN